MFFLYFFIELIVLAVWTVVGFTLWIPLLTRMIAVYVGSIVTALYARNDPTPARVGLQTAIDFYAAGFVQIAKHFQDARGGVAIKSGGPSMPTNWTVVIAEIIWCQLFWGLTVSLFGAWFSR